MRAMIYTAFPVNAWRIPPEHVSRLRTSFPEVEFVQAMNADQAMECLADVDVSLSAQLSPAMVERAARLQWIHSPAAAIADLLPLDAIAQRKVVVTNSRGVQAVPMAEQVMAGLLALSRRLDLTLAAQRKRRWIQEQLGDADRPWMLDGKRMTIVGLGTIGEAIATRAHAFGIRITGVRRRPELGGSSVVERVVGPDQLDQALSGADIAVITAPFVPTTTGIVGAKQISLMNRGAILVNVGRAQIVDTAAMIRALQTGTLGGAVLDVFDKEPLDASSPLWAMPNVVITPHSAGFRATHWDAVTKLFGDNLMRWLKGEPLLNVVDAAAGY